MAYISCNKLWESEFDNIVSKKEKVQDNDLYQFKLKLNDSYKKDEKLTTRFKTVIHEDVINKGSLDKKLSKIEGQISYMEKDYNDNITNSL